MSRLPICLGLLVVLSGSTHGQTMASGAASGNAWSVSDADAVDVVYSGSATSVQYKVTNNGPGSVVVKAEYIADGLPKLQKETLGPNDFVTIRRNKCWRVSIEHIPGPPAHGTVSGSP